MIFTSSTLYSYIILSNDVFNKIAFRLLISYSSYENTRREFNIIRRDIED